MLTTILLASSIIATSEAVERTTIGTSRDGNPLELVILANPVETADERPAILLVAGLDGGHALGPKLLGAIEQDILANHADVLDETTFYILPRMNPDAFAANGGESAFVRRGSSRRIDEDRDGLVDEDPPRDLDGNGVITLMRWKDETLKRPLTHLPDPADTRMMKSPDTGKGESATHVVAIEGIDADGDGFIGEDGPEGVLLDRNFMHLWPEHQLDAGPYPLSEYESRALAEFVLAHPNIVAAIVYGPHDSLVKEPNSKDKDITGRTPKQLDGGDKAAHKQVMERFKDHVGQERTSDNDNAGSFHAWLYAHRGIPTYATTGWGRPEPSDPPDEEEPEEGEQEGEGEAEEETPSPEPADKEESLWLAYSDRDRSGEGFIAWRPFDHPDLGMVEIGGWVPGFKAMPPTEQVPEIAGKHVAWIIDLVEMQPRLAMRGPVNEPLGQGVDRIRFAIRNAGSLPTRTTHGVRTRANSPTIVWLKGVPDDRIMEGQPLVQIDRLQPGEERILEWVVRREAGDRIRIMIEDPVLAVEQETRLEVTP